MKWDAADGIEAEHWDAGGDDLRFLEISIVEKGRPHWGAGHAGDEGFVDLGA